MEEQIPEAWVGQEVTVFFGQEGNYQGGTLVSVSGRFSTAWRRMISMS